VAAELGAAERLYARDDVVGAGEGDTEQVEPELGGAGPDPFHGAPEPRTRAVDPPSRFAGPRRAPRNARRP
jgi:hypothetical protein